MGMLDGKVCIVTGAGHGIGRGHALELAKHGANVIVNDLGGSVKGEGTGKDADLTAELIEERGGVAVANYGDVSSPGGATFALFDDVTAMEFLTQPGLAPSDSRADGPAGLPAGFPVRHSRARSRGDGSRDSQGRESSLFEIELCSVLY